MNEENMSSHFANANAYIPIFIIFLTIYSFIFWLFHFVFADCIAGILVSILVTTVIFLQSKAAPTNPEVKLHFK